MLLLSGCGDEPSDGLNKFPVTGTVLVNGEPAEGVVVRFFRDGLPGSTNADTPLGVTSEDGSFQLSTNGVNDGAVPGSYRLTFTWRTGNAPGSADRLGGKYTKLRDSQVEVVLRGEPNELPPFELTTEGDPQSTSSETTAKTRWNPNGPAGGYRN